VLPAKATRFKIQRTIAVIKVKSNINVVGTSLLKKLEILRDPRPLLRPVAFDVLALMTERIHERGQAGDGSQIGTYNNRYLRIRQKKFKRNGDTKIIVSRTRDLENDWGVVGTPRGYAIAFIKNVDRNGVANSDKIKWVGEQKGKRIAVLTKSEREYAISRLNILLKQQLS